MIVLILDQFVGPGPADLQRNAVQFNALVEEAMADHAKHKHWRAPELKDVPEDFAPPMCTTIYRASPEGLAEVWKYRWDSSG